MPTPQPIKARMCVQFTSAARNGHRGLLYKRDHHCARVRSVKMGIVKLDRPLAGQTEWADVRFRPCSCTALAPLTKEKNGKLLV